MSDGGSNGLLTFLVISACLSSMLFGLILSATNSCINFIHVAFKTCPGDQINCPHQNVIQQISLAAMLLGAGVGSLIGGPLADQLGRRGSMLRLSLVGLPVFVSCSLATNWYFFIIARFLAGATIGAVSVAVPMYISEICPNETRGQFGVCHQLLITIGIFVSDALGLVQTQTIDWSTKRSHVDMQDLSPVDHWWWRVMVGFSVVPCLMSIILWSTVYKSYESPVWLIRTGRYAEARKVLTDLRAGIGTQAIDLEFRSIETAQQATGEVKSFMWALKSPYYRIGVFIGCSLSMLQQLTGINVMITQSTTMFLQVAPVRDATLLTTATGLLNVVMTIVAIPIIEKWGRRKLLLLSSIGTTGSMLVNVITVSTCTQTVINIVVPTMIMIFIMSFAIGWGPCVWIYLSDIYPAEIKGGCFATAIAINWMSCAFVVFGIGSSLSNGIVTYSLFFVLNILGLLFVGKFVVETKGSSVEKSPVYEGREQLLSNIARTVR